MSRDTIEDAIDSAKKSGKPVNLSKAEAINRSLDLLQNSGIVMLVGTIEVLGDPGSKQRLWREGCEVSYPLGVTNPNYSVLKFVAQWGNYYHGLANLCFEV